jgi:hypothetical protein
VLCLERISHFILEAVDSGDWKPFNIRLSANWDLVSRICFFADDMLLFSVANEGQMKQVLSCLNYLFCEASGQKVSVAKTKILFSKNVPASFAGLISHSSGFAKTDNLGKYLGVPLLLHQRISKQTYSSSLRPCNKSCMICLWQKGSLSVNQCYKPFFCIPCSPPLFLKHSVMRLKRFVNK